MERVKHLSVEQAFRQIGRNDLADKIKAGDRLWGRIKNNSITNPELITTFQDLSESLTLYESPIYDACYHLLKLRLSETISTPKEHSKK